MQQVEVAHRFHGPPTMGHGGYVAGLLAERIAGPVAQVTLRKPTPLDRPLSIAQGEGGVRLLDGEQLIAEAVPATLELEVPRPPSLAAAAAAEAGSPSFYGDRGVHPTCFGCSRLREPGDGLRVFVGPCEVEGQRLVAARWSPGASFADEAGHVRALYALAALDCAGAFAFIVDNVRAGLLGRIVLAQHRAVRADQDLIVTGWQIGRDGKKLLAGTALFTADGELCAAAKATWFPF
jgi:hypothetical protein